ncbi:MAG: class II aldolase/adducin family protein [Pseudomonadota bacterium]
MTEADLRRDIVAACRDLAASGLIPGTAGNISARVGSDMLITPSGIPYDRLAPEMLATMALDGSGDWKGPEKPSSEWRFHHDILVARPNDQAIVHTHSPHATALSMTRQPIPPAHYMIAAFGGASVRVSAYARFGTQALSDAALVALQDRSACLLANHGVIATGDNLARAVWRAEELETLAQQYILSMSAGGPVLLTEAEIAEASEAFKTYGPRKPDS